MIESWDQSNERKKKREVLVNTSLFTFSRQEFEVTQESLYQQLISLRRLLVSLKLSCAEKYKGELDEIIDLTEKVTIKERNYLGTLSAYLTEEEKLVLMRDALNIENDFQVVVDKLALLLKKVKNA